MVFEESDLRFEFDPDHWDILQYDLTKEFRNIKDAIPGTKGVDFIGINDNQSLIIIEVKNFRGHRIENKHRIEKEGGLDLEFAQKVKDSISGLIGGVRNSTNHAVYWKKSLDILKDVNKQVELVLWLEEDTNIKNEPFRKDRKGNTFIKKLKKRNKWLTSRVILAHRNSNPYPDTLTVNYI